MSLPPSQPTDFLSLAGISGASPSDTGLGFQANLIPGSSGLSTRQGLIASGRPASSVRNLIHWLVPEGPIVQMYINPQQIRYAYKKATTQQRTKGGFILQYWGEELTLLSITGTTGTSGIEGVNLLRDIYRNEQIAFDPFALTLSAQNSLGAQAQGISNLLGGGDIGNTVAGAFQSVQGNTQSLPPPPSLGQLAFTVEMYYAGSVFRGYFNSFSFTEAANNLGLFDYDMEFVVTQSRGFRENFLGWHRSSTNGPSNSNPQFGTPHSYSTLTDGIGTSATPTLETGSTQITGIQSSINSISDSFNKIF